MDITFFDFMDYLSSKYMLPIGGMLTAIFVVFQWGIPNFLDEFQKGARGKKFNSNIVTVLLLISALVVGFIILNEIIAKISGKAIIG